MGAAATTAAAQLHPLESATRHSTFKWKRQSSHRHAEISECPNLMETTQGVPHVRDNANWIVFVDAFNTVTKGSGSNLRFPA
jgi:hypothetical protein